MKTLFLLLISVSLCSAQNVAVRFYGDKNPQGLPEHWPAQVQPCGKETKVDGFTVMTSEQLADIVKTNKPLYAAWESNKTHVAQAKVDSSLLKLAALYEQIPTARKWTATTLTTCTNIEASLVSGTNTTAQLITRIRQINGEVATQARINAGVLELLQRLGPGLRSMYQAENDETQ